MGLEQHKRSIAFKNIIISMTKGKYPNVSVLDIASGSFCVIKELVKEGIDYTAVEIRKANVESISNDLKQFKNAKVHLGDATKLAELNLSRFDVVIVPGLLYHLSPKDNLKVIRDSIKLAKNGIIIDTVLANEKGNTTNYFEIDGFIYDGRAFYEHRTLDSNKLIESRIRASFQKTGNQYLSYVITEDSLVRLLRKLGCQMVCRYKYAPGINEAPLRPPKTGDENKPWTALMNSERGMVAAYLDSTLLKQETETGYFQMTNGEGKLGDLSESQINEVKNQLCNLMIEKAKASFTNSELFDIIHSAGRMLPLSLHNIIVEAGIQANLKLEEIVELRVYAESYLKSLNFQREKQANKFVTSYLEYLNVFSEDWAVSMATTFKNYLFNYVQDSTQKIILKWKI